MGLGEIIMKVGDLVRFLTPSANNGRIGLVIREALDGLGDKMYTIAWADGHVSNRWDDDLEVVSASR